VVTLQPYAAYLRVYEPLAAFDRQSQRYWRRYVADGRPPARADGPVRQRRTVLDALGAGWRRLPAGPEEAYVIEIEDRMLICPWNLRYRAAEAALAAREGVSRPVADAFVPPGLVAEARRALAERRGAGTPVHEHISGWGVPIRWFVFVDLDERELTLDPGARSLRYRTEMANARRRAHLALKVLRRSVGEAPVTLAVEEGARWLEEFHPHSVVELDYGGLVHLLSDEDLKLDNSSGLVADGLAALARGESDEATSAYERLVERWRAIQVLERCN